jgi:hypothetical protein
VVDNVAVRVEILASSAAGRAAGLDGTTTLPTTPGLDPPPELIEEGIFRAARFGVDAELPDAHGRLRPVSKILEDTIARVEDRAHELGCVQELALLPELLQRGGGASTQRAIHRLAGIDVLVQQTSSPRPRPTTRRPRVSQRADLRSQRVHQVYERRHGLHRHEHERGRHGSLHGGSGTSGPSCQPCAREQRTGREARLERRGLLRDEGRADSLLPGSSHPHGLATSADPVPRHLPGSPMPVVERLASIIQIRRRE